MGTGWASRVGAGVYRWVGSGAVGENTHQVLQALRPCMEWLLCHRTTIFLSQLIRVPFKILQNCIYPHQITSLEHKNLCSLLLELFSFESPISEIWVSQTPRIILHGILQIDASPPSWKESNGACYGKLNFHPTFFHTGCVACACTW